MSPLNIPLKNVSKMNLHLITVTHESPMLVILFVSIGILCLVYAPGNSLSFPNCFSKAPLLLGFWLKWAK